jgi:hypothetical protein
MWTDLLFTLAARESPARQPSDLHGALLSVAEVVQHAVKRSGKQIFADPET